MSNEEKNAQPAIHDERERPSDRKTWVAPQVSDSPVNDLTSSGFVGIGVDNAIYS